MDLASTPVIKTDQTRSNPGAPTAAMLKNVPSQQGRFITSLQQSNAPPALSSVTPGISQASVTKQAMNSVSRLTALPVHSSSTSSTYHVPRGAAAVANIAVPRSSLATPIRGPSTNLQSLGVAASNNSTIVRHSTPQHSGTIGVRPPQQHMVGGGGGGSAPPSTWLSNNSSQASAPSRSVPLPTTTATHFNRATTIGVTRLTTPLATGRVVTDSLSRPVLLQTAPHKHINISNINQQAQMHINDKTFLKTTGVRPQTAVIGGGSRVAGGPISASASSLNRITASASATPATVVSLHPNTVLVQTPSVPHTKPASHHQPPKFVAQSPHIQMQTVVNSIGSSTQPSLTTVSKPPIAFVAAGGSGSGTRPPALHGIANAAAAAACPKVLASVEPSPSAAPAAAIFAVQQTAHKPPVSSVTVPTVGGVSLSSNTGVGSGGGPQPGGGAAAAQFEPQPQLRAVAAATTSAATQPTHAQHTHTPITCRPASSIVTNSQPTVRYNPVMVVDHNRQASLHHFVNNPPSEAAAAAAANNQQTAEGSSTTSSSSSSVPVSTTSLLQTPTKPNASPRPSILRKRESEGTPLKAQKNLTPLLTSLSSASVPPPPCSSVSPPPPRPESRGGSGGGNGGGLSSGGSTTISATSSPGLAVGDRDSPPPGLPPSLPLPPSLSLLAKQDGIQPEPPPLEMSPRKKPRKQQLTGNQMHEPKQVEMEFISEEKLRKESKDGDLGDMSPSEHMTPKVGLHHHHQQHQQKRRNISLLSGYRQPWKSRHHHFLRYTDVRPKEERRPTINEIASQKMVQQKANGWKLYHIGTQMQCLSDLETEVLEKLTDMLKVLERKPGKELDKDINRVNELIKGNIQRCKVIKDQMQEAKSQVMKMFDHKGHVLEILTRCSSKRSVKKRDRM
ncbi:histone deacetylase complex subunit SAP130 isoform X2 [Nilaparvata lugens]|uniref:histone deacetylase complex subunit SAP130 isoform X2 n=1 Tax=Nilaparvata lugens TaxID=108931 RepID=UPI00193D8730|nr:histone deacetylase complex subunit SAP130 isoform X2 [Nilaparvata lugens]